MSTIYHKPASIIIIYSYNGLIPSYKIELLKPAIIQMNIKSIYLRANARYKFVYIAFDEIKFVSQVHLLLWKVFYTLTAKYNCSAKYMLWNLRGQPWLYFSYVHHVWYLFRYTLNAICLPSCLCCRHASVCMCWTKSIHLCLFYFLGVL